MTTSRTRRTVRSAGLVALAAAAAFSLTACGDGDTDAAGSHSKESVSSSRSADDGGSGGTKKSEGKGTEVSSTSSDNTPSSASESPDRTEKLADGSTAKIYELGEQRYRAEIVNDGAVLATLETKDPDADAGLDANGMYVLLSMDGKIHSWMGGEHTGPGTFSLEGGWKAKVTKVSEGRFRAQILGEDDSVMATLDANKRDAGVNANGVPIVLSSGGVISSHA